MKVKVDSIWKSIFTMGAGTFLAQSINVLVQPILTRIVPAETLGIYTYIISLATMIIPVASLKLDMLVVSEKDDNKAQYITDSCIVVNICVAVIYAIVIFLGYFFCGSNLFNRYGAIIFFVPVVVLTNGIRFLFISYNNRYKEYKVIAKIGLLREGTRAIIQVLSGLFSFGVIGQTFGYAASPLAGMRYQLKDYIRKAKERSRLTRRQFISIIREGKNQICFLVPAQFINNLSSSFVIICISSLFNEKTLGFYSAGGRILEIPIIFIAANVSKVCFKEISEKIANSEPICNTLLKIVSALTAVSFCGFGLLFFIAPQISRFIFGAGYEVAGEYIKCLCLMYALRLVATSFAGLFTIFNKQYLELGLNALLVVLAVIVFFISKALQLQVESYLWMISISYSIMYMLMLIGYILLCRNYDIKLKRGITNV